MRDLDEMWNEKSIGDILRYSRENDLCPASKRLAENLDREPRAEPFDEEKHALEKGNWLADEFFGMSLNEIAKYCDFIDDNTEFSTQHGVKGEEYESVLVVIDDGGPPGITTTLQRHLPQLPQEANQQSSSAAWPTTLHTFVFREQKKTYASSCILKTRLLLSRNFWTRNFSPKLKLRSRRNASRL